MCVDCPENVRLVVQNPVVTKNIAFNYILADHDDQEVVLFKPRHAARLLRHPEDVLRAGRQRSPASWHRTRTSSGPSRTSRLTPASTPARWRSCST
ncbi:hypothetical protein JOQ06_022034 [Pogonophryne albipinna]|uniref:Uncharacterized protein n=1 Tax=Pogonophryne albipinna TaxID=1090488 RepID=A0AAD6ABY6_9TELE|nr:hypothetical protein JOQ06_022034 [Pogonophryne albipinna]